jgi:hypothetical protein
MRGRRIAAVMLAVAGLAAPAFATEPAPSAAPPAAAPAPAVPAPASVAPAPARPTNEPAIAPSLAPLAPAGAAGPRGLIHEGAPRPEAAVRIQQRFASKAKLTEIAAGFQYLSRGDFYNSPGVRISAAYYPFESLGLEALVSHYWSSLDATAQEVVTTTGTLPDSNPPGWVGMAGARYSIGYGKIIVGGLGGVLHFEPQAFVHGGIHDNGGEIGPSADIGLGFLVFLMPRLFVRADVPVTLDWEKRYNREVTVFGTSPALSVGGML